MHDHKFAAVLRYRIHTWDIIENLDRFMHGFVGIIDILLHILCIDRREWIVHPTLMPFQPIRNSDPKVSEGFKILDKLSQLVILE